MFAFGSGPPVDPAMFDAIPKRQSTRGDYDGKAVSGLDLQALSAAAAVPGVDLVLITDRPQIDRCAIWSSLATMRRSQTPRSCGN